MDTQRIEEFKSTLEGPVLVPGDQGYDEARVLWNGMFDKKPALIARCKNTRDVAEAVNFGRENQLLIAIKGGGHNSAGTGSCDDGLLIDLSLMNHVEVNEDSQVVTLQGGCLLSQVDAETQKYGLAVSSGIISHTGVGGLTLGGGFGWISRKHGLTIDSLVSAEIVTASGEIVTASDSENPDLFWAIRGGGGNFGVVTRFKIKAHKIGNEVFSGIIAKEYVDLKKIMHFFRSYVRKMPDEITIWMVVRHAPPLPFIPEKYHGKLVVLIPFVHLGDKEKGEELIQPIRDAEESIGEGSGMNPWSAWQQGFDPLVEHGARNYWKSHHIKELSDECIDVIDQYAQKMPSKECEIFIPHMEGAPSRVSSSATAFSHRKTPFLLNIHTRWRDQADDETALKWAKDFHEATAPFSQGVYVNFLSDEGKARVRQAYTNEVWSKLLEVKRKWDPDNLFRVNQNIDPHQASERQHDLVH